MKPRKKARVRATHSIAAEIHEALSDADMTAAELARKCKESEAFIRRILVGENGIGRLIHADLLQTISDETGRDLTIHIYAAKPVRRRIAVKSD